MSSVLSHIKYFIITNQNIKGEMDRRRFKKGYTIFRYKFIGKECNKPSWGTEYPLIEFIKNII